MGIKALDIYGLSEVMGPGVAMECLKAAAAPPFGEDHFLPEIICPETGVAHAGRRARRTGVHHPDQRGRCR